MHRACQVLALLYKGQTSGATCRNRSFKAAVVFTAYTAAAAARGVAAAAAAVAAVVLVVVVVVLARYLSMLLSVSSYCSVQKAYLEAATVVPLPSLQLLHHFKRVI